MLSFAILRLPDFCFLLLTRVFVLVAMQAQAVIVGWQIYSLTKDPFLLGLAGLAEAVPAILCALVAGHVVDTGNPRRIYLTSISVMVLNCLALYLFAGGLIPAPESSILVLIFAGVFLSGLARSFVMPASFSLLAKIVPREHIPAASGWMSSGLQAALITGPALAGIVYGFYGARGAWILPVSFMVLAFVMMYLLRAAPPDKYRIKEPAIQSIKAGWRFIFENPVMLSVMTLDMFAVLLGGAVALLPAYADEVLNVGAEGLGVLRAAPAIGAVGMALYLAVNPMRRVSATKLLLAVAAFGLCIIGFGISKIFWLSVFFLLLSGAFDSISVVIRSTIMQILTPDHMRGRVSAVNSMFIISSNEIGAFRAGVMARFTGLVPSVVIGGIAALLVVAATASLSPRFRRTVINAANA